MDIKQFEKEFEKLYMPLGMYALRLLDDSFEAEDVVQEAFAAVWQLIDSGADIKSFKSYMYRSVHNFALMRLRMRREQVDINQLADLTDDVIDTSERDARLWRAIDHLPQRCREVFLLSKRDGLTYAEIADELGISVKTVENQISKAYDRLRDSLSAKHFFLPFL
jgi:RNA polymerase sigma-70 factor (ECF subfamily)